MAAKGLCAPRRSLRSLESVVGGSQAHYIDNATIRGYQVAGFPQLHMTGPAETSVAGSAVFAQRSRSERLIATGPRGAGDRGRPGRMAGSFPPEGPASPLYLYFLFSLLCATLRWEWRGTLWSAGALLAMGEEPWLHAASWSRGELWQSREAPGTWQPLVATAPRGREFPLRERRG
jgi:hypothetical protein